MNFMHELCEHSLFNVNLMILSGYGHIDVYMYMKRIKSSTDYEESVDFMQMYRYIENKKLFMYLTAQQCI